MRFGYGANANPKDHAAFEARFGFPLIEAWAMTETGGGALVAASREPRHVGTRCIGFPPRGWRFQSLKQQRAARCAHAGPDPRRGFFSGYLKDEKATEEAWRDGWFHTGDAVRRGPDGALHFVDRLKNIIRRAGENIAALEVEAALAGHPAIAQVAVIAVPDAVRDEEVMACVVLNDASRGAAETAISIQDWCLERLSYFKAPGYVAFVDALPTTATNKVQKAKLADFALESGATRFDLRERKKSTAAKSATTASCVAAPVTVPYVRYSIRAAHWWLGTRLFELFSRPLRLEKGPTSTASPSPASPSPPTPPSASPSTSACRRAGSTTSRSAARAAWWRCGARRARCRRATPTSWPASPATPTTSIPSA